MHKLLYFFLKVFPIHIKNYLNQINFKDYTNFHHELTSFPISNLFSLKLGQFFYQNLSIKLSKKEYLLNYRFLN